jgi:hypothetical protein
MEFGLFFCLGGRNKKNTWFEVVSVVSELTRTMPNQ